MIHLAGWGYYFFYKSGTSGDRITFLDNYSFIKSYEKISSSPDIFRVVLSDDSNEEVFLVFEDAVGYQSLIEIVLITDNRGVVRHVETFAQGETPQFYDRLNDQGFFDQFSGQNISRGFECGVNVDAVSRVTISSQAVARAVHKGVDSVGEAYLHIAVEKRYDNIKFGISEWAIILMFLLVILSYWKKDKKLRYLALTYSVAILGFKLTLFISYSYFFSFLTGNWPSVAEDLKRYLLFGGSILLVSVTGKNLYCSHICPFGAFQKLEFRLAKFPSPVLSRRLKKISSAIPGILAYLAFLAALLSGRSSFTNYEPFSLLYGGLGTGFQWVLLPLTLFSALFLMRFYCNTACPVGFAMGKIVQFRRFLGGIWKRNV